MERCPLCNARLRDKSICSRCDADLSLLQTIESKAKQLAEQAIHRLLAGEMEAARTLAASACDLHITPFHQALSKYIETMGNEEFFHPPSELMCNRE